MYVNNKAVIAKGEDFIHLNLNMLNLLITSGVGAKILDFILKIY